MRHVDRRPLPQIVLGLLIIAIGVIALLGRADVLDAGALISTWWPMLIIGVGIASLLTAPRAWVGPLVVIAIGIFFQLSTLGVVDGGLWDFLWPIGLIVLGLAILLRLGGRSDDSAVVDAAVIWWGTELRTTSQQFRGGGLSAIMGGIEVDLRQAGIESRADISVFVWWGAVEIKVPPTWRVRMDGLPILGGWEDKTTLPESSSAPELRVHVTAVMGGVEVKN